MLFHTELVVVVMICIHIKFHMPLSNGSLVIAIKPWIKHSCSCFIFYKNFTWTKVAYFSIFITTYYFSTVNWCLPTSRVRVSAMFLLLAVGIKKCAVRLCFNGITYTKSPENRSTVSKTEWGHTKTVWWPQNLVVSNLHKKSTQKELKLMATVWKCS